MSVNNKVSKASMKRHCAHVNCDVELKTTFVFPSDIMPEPTRPRIDGRSCSHYLDCKLQDKSICLFNVEAGKM